MNRERTLIRYDELVAIFLGILNESKISDLISVQVFQVCLVYFVCGFCCLVVFFGGEYVVAVFWGFGVFFKSCLGRMLSLQSSIITPEAQHGTLSGFCLSGLLHV